MIPFAHYLGLPGRVSETAKTLPAKASAAVSRVLNRKPVSASASLPQASRPVAPAAVTRTPTPSAGPSSSSGIERAIAAERARAAEILVEGIRAGCVNQACALAFDSDLTAAQAIAAINAGARDTAAQGNRLGRRMGLDPDQPTGSTSGRAPTAKELAARIVAAGERAATGNTSAGAVPAKSAADRIVAAGERARGETA
jgi:hypothetical protein